MSRNQRTTVILRELQHAWEHDLQPADVHAFAKTGKLSIANALPLASFAVVAAAAKRVFVRPLVPMTHTIEARHSRNVREVTLLTTSKSMLEKRRSVELHAPELAIAAVWADGMVHRLGRRLVDLAYINPGNTLQTYESNQMLVRRMQGSIDDLSVYGYDYAPVTECGAHVSLALDDGIDLGISQTMPSNTLSIYAAHDLSNALTIDPPKYGFRSTAPRLSLEFIRSEG